MTMQEYATLIQRQSDRMSEVCDRCFNNSKNAAIVAATTGLLDVMRAITTHKNLYNDAPMTARELNDLDITIKKLTYNRNDYAYQGMMQLAIGDLHEIYPDLYKEIEV